MRSIFVFLLVTASGLACSNSSPRRPLGAGGDTEVDSGDGTPPMAGQGGTTGAAGAPGAGGSGGSPVDTAKDAGIPATVDAAIPGDSASARADSSNAESGPVTSAGCPAGALVCDDFEKYAVGGDLTAGGWRSVIAHGTMRVDATKPFSGGKSVHISSPTNVKHNGMLARDGAPLFPIANNTIYGRMMFWVDQLPVGPNVHYNWVQANGTFANSTEYAKYGWGGKDGKVQAGYTVRTGPDGHALPVTDCAAPLTTALPEKKWVCVEWKFDGTNHEMHYWLDGQPAGDILKKDGTCTGRALPDGIWKAPIFGSVVVGWGQYEVSPGTLEAWMDDIVIATDRIGCPPH